MRRNRKLPAGVKQCLQPLIQVENDEFQLAWQQRVLRDLEAFPPEVWQLGIDWSKETLGLWQAARPKLAPRKATAERKAHATIANSLRRVAQRLRRSEEVDPDLALLLYFARDHGMPHGCSLWSKSAAAESRPTLSRFLRVVADLYSGKHGNVYGIHRPLPKLEVRGLQRRHAAARTAASQLAKFFRERTGTPHWDLVGKIVTALYVDSNLDLDALARAERYQQKKTGKNRQI